MKIPFFTKQEESKPEATKPFAPYEEIQEKKTTKLGYILLFIMVMLGVWQGQGFIDSFAQNIKDPEQISECSRYLNGIVDPTASYYGYSSYGYAYNENILSNCKYSLIEQKHSIQGIIAEINLPYTLVQNLQKDLNALQSTEYQLRDSMDREKRNYGISLQEKTAKETTVVYNTTQVKTTLMILEEQYSALQSNINQKQAEIDSNNAIIKSIAVRNAAQIKAVFSDYKTELKKVEFKRALLILLLIGPVLFLTTRKYFKQKKENSQYSIIWAAVATIFALLFAQVFFSFIYQILPHELILKLLELFAQFAFLVTIGQYFLLLLTPVLFGGIVYWIQKKVYNKKAVMIRALKSHKCPSCSMSLHESNRYCPVCHYQIKETCESCKGERVVGLAYCPSCGVSKEGSVLEQ